MTVAEMSAINMVAEVYHSNTASVLQYSLAQLGVRVVQPRIVLDRVLVSCAMSPRLAEVS